MDKTYKNEFYRLFIIQDLPEPLTRASRHLQIFDNYIENTRLRIRSVRIPETKAWSWILQQRFPVDENLSHWKMSEIYLNETEHRLLEPFEEREIRKNRYFFDYDNRQIEFDVFLGPLWGLNLGKAAFETLEELRNFKLPSFAVFEVTGNSFFAGENLVEKKFSDVQTEFEKMINSKQGI